MYSYNNLYLEDHNPQHYQCFQPDPTLSSNSDEPGITFISHTGIGGKRRPLDNTYYSSNALVSSSLAELRSNPYKHNMGTSVIRRYLSSGVSGPPDWPLNSGHQAKRARIENIIKGMTGSPIRDVTMEASQDERSVNMQGDKRAQKCPQLHHYNNHLERSGEGTSVSQESPGNHNVNKEMHGRQMTLGQLQESFALEDEGSECEVGEGTVEQNHLTWDDYHNASPQDTLTGPYNALETPSDKTYQGCKKLTLMNCFKSKPDKVNKLMADLLKYELSQALSTRIDSIFKHRPLLQQPPNVALLTDKLLHFQEEHSSFCRDSTSSLSCSERTQDQVPQVQTDALPLVVKKSPPDKSHVANLLPLARAHHRPKSPLPFSCQFALHEDKALEKISRNSAQHNSLRFLQDGILGAGHPKMDAVDVPWSSVKMRTKVNSSRSIRSPKTSLAMDPKMIYECAPHVKIECDDLQGTMKNNVYVLNEGLTTNHLKKAKLIFFYTRYPSSLVLKTFFHDVQFTRCVTSQIIKWFSNFREFYYIQMEKHARRAFMEGVADVRHLTVGRESELFRALNMHYNKANDFQVPERFLEVAEITVREFYIAISMGRDSDPSWKKAIYKGICKLDSDIPSEFKSQS